MQRHPPRQPSRRVLLAALVVLAGALVAQPSSAAAAAATAASGRLARAGSAVAEREPARDARLGRPRALCVGRGSARRGRRRARRARAVRRVHPRVVRARDARCRRGLRRGGAPAPRRPAAPAAGARHQIAPAFFAVNVAQIFQRPDTSEHADAALAAAAAQGVVAARADAYWEWAEPSAPVAGAHAYDWRRIDEVVLALARHGIRWQPIVAYSTDWATSAPGSVAAPPQARYRSDFAAYAAALVRRYGPSGAFWSDHPALRALPVRTWEIWNEPNKSSFWGGHPDPAGYADLLTEASGAVRSADPGARVVFGGQAPDGGRFLAAALAARPRVRDAFDAVAYHPYDLGVARVLAQVRDLRARLRSMGLGGTPLLLNELGWPARDDRAQGMPGQSERAALLAGAATALAWSDCGVESIAPYTWMSAEQDPGDADQWYGLWSASHGLTPGGLAYARVVRAEVGSRDGGAAPLCADPGGVDSTLRATAPRAAAAGAPAG